MDNVTEQAEVCECGELLDGVHVCPSEPENPDKIRTHMPKMNAETRTQSFDEVELGLTEEMAVQEAFRCLGCEVEICVACKICAEICPVSCINIEVEKSGTGKKFATHYDINAATCMFCGHCAEACPTKTLAHTKEYELSIFNKSDMRYVLKDQLPRVKNE